MVWIRWLCQNNSITLEKFKIMVYDGKFLTLIIEIATKNYNEDFFNKLKE